MEATGIYSLDLAFALDAAEGIEVAVLNPKVANRFAQTIRRSKTDAADAEVLAEYARRMPFTAWVAPSLGSMRLRSIVRHVESLSVQSAQNQNRLHAAQGSTSTPGCIVQDLKHSVASLELRIHKLRREAMTLVRQDDLLRKRFELLVSIPGIAQVSAMQYAGGNENLEQTEQEIVLAALGNTADEKPTGFALSLALTDHLGLPRDTDPDLLSEAEALFAPSKPKKVSKPKAAPALVKPAEKKTTAKKQKAA